MDNSTLKAKLKGSHTLNKDNYSGFKTPMMKMLTGDDLIDAYNLEASEIIHTIDGQNQMHEYKEYKSPFMHKQRASNPINIAKWFPIGSKGRENKPVRMVA